MYQDSAHDNAFISVFYSVQFTVKIILYSIFIVKLLRHHFGFRGIYRILLAAFVAR